MFHDMPAAILNRMKTLEDLDARQRQEEPSGKRRIYTITPDTGRFLAILAAGSPSGQWIEIGTGSGFSALWLALAARQAQCNLTTYEIDAYKVRLAGETFREAQVEDVVELIQGDARRDLGRFPEVSFCFLDAEKEIYADCYELVVPRLVKGGFLVADNATSHGELLASFLERVRQDERVDALIVPVGYGELVCRRV
jgi:predicted O-methyltransferase YrrM